MAAINVIIWPQDWKQAWQVGLGYDHASMGNSRECEKFRKVKEQLRQVNQDSSRQPFGSATRSKPESTRSRRDSYQIVKKSYRRALTSYKSSSQATILGHPPGLCRKVTKNKRKAKDNLRQVEKVSLREPFCAAHQAWARSPPDLGRKVTKKLRNS